jgi:hypothetical protein
MCGYNLSGSAVWRCSECGRPIVPLDVPVHHARVSVRERLLGMLLVHGMIGAGVVLVMGLGAGVLTERVVAAAEGSVVCVLAVGGSWVLGGCAVMLGPRRDRAVSFSVWVRTAWFLHAPWLCMPLCAGAIMSMAVIERGLVGQSGVFTGFTAAVGLLMWIVALPYAFLRWARSFGRGSRALGAHPKGMMSFLLAALLTLLVAAAAGLAGGSVAVSAAMRLASPDFWDIP